MVRYHEFRRNGPEHCRTARAVSAKRMSAVMICVVVAAALAGISAAEPVWAESTARSGERWTASLVRTARTMEKYDFRYSYSAPGGSLAASLKGDRVSNCSKYVSWALQDYGMLRKGQTFWITKSGAIRGSTEAVKGNSRLKVLHPSRPAAKAGMKPGDICGWSGMMHTAVYAGKNSKGQMLWYSAGRDGAVRKGGRWYFKAARITARPRASRYSGKICTVIRIRNLKYGTGKVKSADSGGDLIESSTVESAEALLPIPDPADIPEVKEGPEDADAMDESCTVNEASETDETDEVSRTEEAEKNPVNEGDEENPARTENTGKDKCSNEDENRREGESGDEYENRSDANEQDNSGETDGQAVSEETESKMQSGGTEEGGSPEESVTSGPVGNDSADAPDEEEDECSPAASVSSEIHSSEGHSEEGISKEVPETGDHEWLRDAAVLILALNGIYLLRRARIPGR